MVLFTPTTTFIFAGEKLIVVIDPAPLGIDTVTFVDVGDAAVELEVVVVALDDFVVGAVEGCPLWDVSKMYPAAAMTSITTTIPTIAAFPMALLFPRSPSFIPNVVRLFRF